MTAYDAHANLAPGPAQTAPAPATLSEGGGSIVDFGSTGGHISDRPAGSGGHITDMPTSGGSITDRSGT